MYPNAKVSEQIGRPGVIPPINQPIGTVSTPWVSASKFRRWLAVINTGVLGASATVDAKLQQAIDSSGTSAKDIPGKSITQIVKATGDNKAAMINLNSGEMDVNGNFNYLRLSITVGGAASMVSGELFGGGPTLVSVASQENDAGVVQVVP